MSEQLGKGQIYEYCRTRGQMVRLDVIRSRISMPDGTQTDMIISPTGCNREEQCRREKIRCLVYVENGIDPCPDAWKSEL